MEAIILAGGRGTRIASVLPDLPKALAPVGGRPFLALLLARLKAQGVRRVILSVGYKADLIRAQLGDAFDGIPLAYAHEQTPLGTGGALRNALAMAAGELVFALNGDTCVDLDFAAMLANHEAAAAALSIAVAQVADCSRYGRVLPAGDRIVGFAEKGFAGPGLISAGVYLLRRDLFEGFDLPAAFSLESDFLAPRLNQLRPLAFVTSGCFIDIGIPADLARAQRELT